MAVTAAYDVGIADSSSAMMTGKSDEGQKWKGQKRMRGIGYGRSRCGLKLTSKLTF